MGWVRAGERERVRESRRHHRRFEFTAFAMQHAEATSYNHNKRITSEFFLLFLLFVPFSQLILIQIAQTKEEKKKELVASLVFPFKHSKLFTYSIKLSDLF